MAISSEDMIIGCIGVPVLAGIVPCSCSPLPEHVNGSFIVWCLEHSVCVMYLTKLLQALLFHASICMLLVGYQFASLCSSDATHDAFYGSIVRFNLVILSPDC